MDVYDFNEEQQTELKITKENLPILVSKLSVDTDVEDRGKFAIVRVRAGQGSAMYLALGGRDMMWLQSKSHKQEARGDYTLFYIRYVVG